MPKESCEGLPWVFCFSELSQRRGGILFGSLTQGPSKGFHGFFERFLERAQRVGLTALGKKALSIEDFGSAEKIKGLPCLFELRLATFENLL